MSPRRCPIPRAAFTAAALCSHTSGVQNRREMWRAFMGCFEPAADPRDALERGFYVPRPGRVLGEELAARFEVKPSASHLLVGGVGSGKTTQLLVARDALKAAGDVCALYVDVSLSRDPKTFWWGHLLVIASLQLAAQLGAARPRFDDQIALFEFLLGSDGPWEQEFLERLSRTLSAVLSILTVNTPHVVLLIDSLDRMTDLGRFSEIATEAVPRLRSLGIGVILVGPLTAIYGIQGTIADRFDRFHHLPAVDVDNDADGRNFLVQVLRARDQSGLISEDAAIDLASFSGGVLRDLIALAQLAGEEAYVDGADRVEVRHVEAAADIFGRKQMTALDSEQMKSLQTVRANGTFVQMSERDLALLSTRRVLEYPQGNPRFAVHPTMEYLLARIAEGR
jgi:hypothetical protein